MKIHVVIMTFAFFFKNATTNIQMNNNRTYRYASQTTIRSYVWKHIYKSFNIVEDTAIFVLQI